MGYVTVKFLGEEYQVPEAINEFLHYDELLTPVRLKMLNTLQQDIKRDSRQMKFGEGTTDHVVNNAMVYQKLMEECANVLVNKLFALGIYDVTATDLLGTVTSIADLNELKMNTLQNMLAEGRRYVDMKNRGIERAYRSAASNITGSGVMVFSSSITTLMIHSVVERGILLSQAKKADKEYEEAVRAINASTRYALDTMVSEVMVKQYYPAIMDILMEFSTKITSAFLVELVRHDKFDFESVEKYNMQKAEQMLTNINHVPDKAAFLKQAFNVCPFSLDVYEKCLEYGLLDGDTFKTAEYFGFADNLAEKMDEYINHNLQSKEKIKPIISILTTYRHTNEIGIWRKLYRGTIDSIENNYKKLHLALTSNRNLDSYVREYICSNMSEVVKRTTDQVGLIIKRNLSSIVSETNYCEFVEMGLLSPERIRKAGSTADNLSEINGELSEALIIAVMAYIEEAKRRLSCYERSKAELDKTVKDMEAELTVLKAEREKLGFFAFSKKKEMTTQIENRTQQIADYKKTHESNRLWSDFEKMYQ